MKAGVEMVQYDHQLFIYYIENKNDQNYFVINEMLHTNTAGGSIDEKRYSDPIGF
jgi:hypothetical protein